MIDCSDTAQLKKYWRPIILRYVTLSFVSFYSLDRNKESSEVIIIIVFGMRT